MAKETVIKQATTVVLNAETAFIADHIDLYNALLPNCPHDAEREIGIVLDEKERLTRIVPDEEETRIRILKKKGKWK